MGSSGNCEVAGLYDRHLTSTTVAPPHDDGSNTSCGWSHKGHPRRRPETTTAPMWCCAKSHQQLETFGLQRSRNSRRVADNNSNNRTRRSRRTTYPWHHFLLSFLIISSNTTTATTTPFLLTTAFSSKHFSGLQRQRRRTLSLLSRLSDSNNANTVDLWNNESVPSGVTTVLSTSTSQNYYQTFTVKELRNLVQASANRERGLLSRLKRKQDLIDYLVQQQQQESDDDETAASMPSSTLWPVAAECTPTNGVHAKEENCSDFDLSEKKDSTFNDDEAPTTFTSAITTRLVHKQKGTLPIRLPPPPPQQQQQYQSPKDAIFEQVYQRYPPVHDALWLVEPADDVRQEFHPVLQARRSSSDMDIVCIGTASCTPGVSRGVSCTALRLNWGRRNLPTAAAVVVAAPLPYPNKGPTAKVTSSFLPTTTTFTTTASTTTTIPSSMFQGGTWLFDVGECTQVRVRGLKKMCFPLKKRAQDETRDAGTSLRKAIF